MTNFKRDASKQYLAALAALRALLAAEGEDDVHRVYSDAVHVAYKEQYTKRDGLKESAGALCVQRLLGKQCKVGYQGKRCECRPPGADHMSLWLKDGKPHVYVMQPYGLSYRQLAELYQFCERHGLRADVDAWPGWHFPGSVLHVAITKAGQDINLNRGGVVGGE